MCSKVAVSEGRRVNPAEQSPLQLNLAPQISLPPITEEEFALFQSLILREAGIYLSCAKQALLVGRLSKHVGDLGLQSFAEYYRYIQQVNGAELQILLDYISTNETHFFREPGHFDYLESHVYPRWEREVKAGRREPRVRVWSAGCSTGEEPFTLAMHLLHRFPSSSGWQIEILATDLSARALERAERAEWPIAKAAEIPTAYLKLYMFRGTHAQAGKMKASPELRSLIRFQPVNLNEEKYPIDGVFDLVFCRNVLIYFLPEGKTRVIESLLGHLAPSGYFFLGHAENLTGCGEQLRSVAHTVYVRRQHEPEPERDAEVRCERTCMAS